MTKPHYPQGCAARSKDCGSASASPYAGNSDYAWGINFNNGNANWNNRNNDGFVRAVRGPVSPRPGECQRAQVSLQDLYQAMRRARRHKRPSRNQLAFDARWIDGLLDLQARLNAGTWTPSPATCFIADKPKAREIHAPDFADRVVHHWLVPQIEALFEPGFIHDSFSNRPGKGTHAAVDRLRTFLRQVHSGQGGGWYLQLDVANFFNRIHRPTLWTMLKARMQRAGLPAILQRATHALARHSPHRHGVVYISTAAARAKVPAHKRLENAPPGYGLPIGNLSSQFFANVYLDALDQFVKHELKAKRYLRYVDDFILVHESREQLQAWHAQIRTFLQDQLRLELKPDTRLKPITAGVDFLGYIVYPTHTRIRARVIHHARQKLTDWRQRHVRGSTALATPADYRRARSIWASYEGHFRHGNSFRLKQAFHQHFPWLHAVAGLQRRFDYRLEGERVAIRIENQP